MARRSKSSPIIDLIFLVSKLPWWLSIVLAVISCFYLNSLAVLPEIDPQKPTAHLSGVIIYNLTYWLQYIIPVLLLIGAVKSFYNGYKRSALLNNVRYSAEPIANTLSTVSWHEFELLVGQFFREKGYKIHETAGGADGGVDLRLTASNFKTYLVQCKHWKASKVPVSVVRELYGVMIAEKAAGAFVVASGEFTKDAAAFAYGKNIELIDGSLLVASIRKEALKPNSITMYAENNVVIPSCPRCNSNMLLRTSRKGVNTGNQFYGCSAFPKCRATITL